MKMRQGVWYLLVIAFMVFPGAAGAQSGGFQPLSSNPQSLFFFKGYIYCSAEDGVHGRELWRVSVPDGEARLVKDITPGVASSTIDRMYAFKGMLYFRVLDARHGGELWWSDGEPEGKTERLIRFSPSEPEDGLVSILGDVGGTLFFARGRELDARMLYAMDGTPGGIRRFLPSPYNVFNSNSLVGCLVNDRLYFHALGNRGVGTPPDGLWSTDGTEAGTTLIATFDEPPGGFCAMGDRGLLFFAKRDPQGAEPWFTGGTPESTFMLKDIWPGEESSGPADPAYVEVIGRPEYSRAFFRATDPEHGSEMWETDGTPEGTKLAFDIVPGREGSNPYRMAAYGETMYFNATTPEAGNELWRARYGTSWIAEIILDINPGFPSSNPYAYAPLRNPNGLLFSAKTNLGEELWVAVEHKSTAELVRDIYEGPESSEPWGLTSTDTEAVVFRAYDPLHGWELWISNGVSNTRLLADLYADHFESPSSFPEMLTPLNDVLVFVADDIEHGLELWVTDGTSAGTELLRDTYPGAIGSQPSELTVVGDLVYFTAEHPETGWELYVTDGTKAGTGIAGDISPEAPGSRPRHLTEWNGNLIFSASRPYEGEEPWIVRPGRKPDILFNIRPDGADSSPRNFVGWKDHVYFVANDGIHGEELWRSDGTAEGTELVRDLVTVPFEKMSYRSLEIMGDRLVIAGDDGVLGDELWVMDHALSPPRLVEDIASFSNFRKR